MIFDALESPADARGKRCRSRAVTSSRSPMHDFPRLKATNMFGKEKSLLQRKKRNTWMAHKNEGDGQLGVVR